MMKNVGPLLCSYMRFKCQRLPKERSLFERWQDARIRAFLRRTVPQSPFYQEHFRGHDLKDWRNLPTIDKSTMMENFDRLNTVGIQRDQAFAFARQEEQQRSFSKLHQGYIVGMSSGTSGNRGLFLVSPKESMLYGGMLLAKAMPSPLWQRQRIALYLRANSPLYSNATGRRHVRMRYYDLLEPVESSFADLTAFQPTALAAPPSALRILAQAQKRGQITINPAKIVSVAEVLEDQDRHLISTAFKQMVHQYYQCTEGFLGMTCAYGTLHLAEDIVAIQPHYEDAERKRFSPIITDFNRATQPIIRYRLNDILVHKDQPCPCGSILTAIERIEGRSDDIFYFQSSNSTDRWIRIFPDFFRREILSASHAISEYQVRQIDASTIEIALEYHPGASSAGIQQQVQHNIQQLADRTQSRRPNMLFRTYKPPQPGQKMRRIVRTWKPMFTEDALCSS